MDSLINYLYYYKLHRIIYILNYFDNYFDNYLSESLGRARGKSLLWVILKKLSRKEMKLNEVSRSIYRSSAVTKNLLTRLIDVDLIVKDGNVYSFKNKLLRYFVDGIYYAY